MLSPPWTLILEQFALTGWPACPALNMPATMLRPPCTLIPAANRSDCLPRPSSPEHDGHHAQPAMETDSRSHLL